MLPQSKMLCIDCMTWFFKRIVIQSQNRRRSNITLSSTYATKIHHRNKPYIMDQNGNACTHVCVSSLIIATFIIESLYYLFWFLCVCFASIFTYFFAQLNSAHSINLIISFIIFDVNIGLASGVLSILCVFDNNIPNNMWCSLAWQIWFNSFIVVSRQSSIRKLRLHSEELEKYLLFSLLISMLMWSLELLCLL